MLQFLILGFLMENKTKLSVDLGDRIVISLGGINDNVYFFVKVMCVKNLDGFGYWSFKNHRFFSRVVWIYILA